jgi:hypothetical protein
MATNVTITGEYRIDDYFDERQSGGDLYIYTGTSGGYFDPSLYYSASQLDAGQLDNRYYTETESDNLFVNVSGDTMGGDLTFPDTYYSFFGDLTNGAGFYSDGTYLRLDDGGAAAALAFFITADIPNTFIYSNNIYLGDASGDTVNFRRNELLGGSSYSSGFTGSGWTIQDTASENYLAEFDDLIVRGSMQVYDLTVNKIRSTGGTMWVTDYAESLDVVQNDGSDYLLVEPDSNTLAANDKIRGQRFTGTAVYKYEYTVSSISSDRTKVYVTGATAGDFTKDMTFVRVGNSSDTARQGSLFLTSSLVNSPYMEVLDGMTTHTIGATARKARIGNLTGLTFDGENIGGYGLYADLAYLQGKVVATEGYIGDWSIQGGSLYSDTGSGDITLDGEAAQIVIKDAGEM